jgi:hypothetical protein
MRSVILIVFHLAFVLPTVLFGQTQKNLTITLDRVPFSRAVSEIEGKTGYHFFYNTEWTDSLIVSAHVENKSIAVVLDQMLTNTDLNYAVDQEQNIFITRGRKILADLPADFFFENQPTGRPAVAFDFSDYERKEKQKKIAEAKLYPIGARTTNMQGTATVAGSIRNTTSGEAVIGAVVYVENPVIGVTTDQFGYYALTLPKGKHELKVKSVGMKSTQRVIMLYANGKLDIDIDEDITPLKEVVIESDQDIRVTGIQMGMEKLDIKTMRQIPLALGETDIMKVVLTLPGVQSVGEGTVGLNVRGGATNQNLILFNDAVVYNPSHLFGFFSTFNPDVLKNVELYKSGITADYGGRLSSVLDVHTREGNAKKFSGSGGISPITGRFTLEGPIVKDKTSFIIGVRSTYSDWILNRLNTKEMRNSTASFYDLTGQVTHKVNDNNSFYLSSYISNDRFRLNSDTIYSYSDRNGSLKWKHVFNNKLYGVLTGGFSQYDYTVGSQKFPINAFTMDFSLQQWNAKADFSFFPTSRHTVNAGISTTRYDLAPGRLRPKGAESLVTPEAMASEQGQESAIYASETFEVNPNLSIYFGLRYSFYQNLGPRDVYRYADGLPREEPNITDTVHYASGKSIAQYSGAEPRFSVRYSLSKNASVKLSYNRMKQYIQMLSNTTAIQPTDIWKLSDAFIKPQTGDQFSLGFYKNLKGGSIETSVETYYKTMQNTVDYKGGAVLLLNPALETDVLNASGKAYGIEWMIKKSAGKLNGWITYTYSRSFLKAKSAFSSETVNRGEYYPSNYDKPHAVNFIGNYKFSRRFNFSLNLIYNTGRPITLPVARYELGGTGRLLYSDRNEYRIPDYFRSDISINIEGNHKVRKLAHSSWTFAVYNLTGRANAYSVFFVTEEGKVKGYKLSVFARPIPTITYNFKF